MQKVIVLGLVLAMAMGLSVAASADFVKDTNWQVFFSLSNGVYSTTTGQYGNAGADVQVGNSETPGTTNGTSFTSTSAFVRDMSSSGGGYGLTKRTVLAADQGTDAIVQTWDGIQLFTGGAYTATNLILNIWGISIDPDGPALQLVVTQAVAGSGFTVGQVVFDSITTATKRYPSMTIDLTEYKAVYQAANSTAPAVTFRLTATTPAESVVPEPGSMLAMFSGLVGLVGFGIRRRK